MSEDELQPWQRETVDVVVGSDYYRWCGIELVDVSRGSSELRFRPRKEMLGLGGAFNGGIVGGLLELPSFLALLPDLAEGEVAVTSDIFVQHMRPIPREGEISLEGRLIRRGRRMAWTEARASAAGSVLTLARITKTLLPKA